MDQSQENEQDYENVWSRLLATLGKEALQKLQASKILLVGLNGLGAEIAKNIVLMGVKSLVVLDPQPVSLKDLSAQFFFSESDVTKNRAEVSLPKIKELNDRVEVRIYNGELTEQFLSEFTVVVIVDERSRAELERINTFCHHNNIAFIAGGVWGLFGWCFSDFGESFVCLDSNGEQPKDAYIESITKATEGLITVDNKRHDLEDGDVILIQDVEGMTQVNNKEWTVKVPGPYSLSIGDTTGFDDYKKGGKLIQVKVPKKLSFKPLTEFFGKAPSWDNIIIADGNKFMRTGQYSFFLQAILKFIEEKKRFPTPGSQSEADEVIVYANEFAKQADAEHLEFDDSTKLWMSIFAKGSSGVLSPMASVFGGILGQEIIKAVSSKYTPIKQFFFLDSQECLSSYDLSEEECAPRGTRYDSQIAVFGNTFNEKILNLRYFLVGAGAIGCEVLKCWAMMGIGCGPNGHVDVTDMDTIEISNLNRQFLYRPWDVTHPKAEVASKAVRSMNPAMKIEHWTVRVGPDTENTYNDDFFQKLDGVCNALDNVQARLYMDGRCVFYGKSLLESGTQGTKGNVQVVAPYLTESYGASMDPPTPETPVCLLHSFPNNIQHCLQWAREILFEASFVQEPEVTNKFITEKDYITGIVPTARVTTALQLENTLLSRPKSFEDCVRWARRIFEERYVIQIEQLLYNFPKDYTDQHGAPFWSGAKRPPTPLQFSSSNQQHMDFIISATFLKAYVCGIIDSELKPKTKADYEARINQIRAVVDDVEVPKFVPKKLNIVTDEKVTKQAVTFSDEEEIRTKSILEKLPSPSQAENMKMKPVVFEKDDDQNFHIDFIAAASNLRALNYSIPTASRLESKIIAGKIIPAIVTTTAAIVGFVNLELYKLQCGQKKLEDYKNTFVNLAISVVQQSDPLAPKELSYVGRKFTLWDRIDIRLGDCTLQAVMDLFEKEYGLEINMLGVGQLLAYVSFSPSAAQRRKMKITDIVELVSKKKLDPNQKYMFLDPTCCTVDTGADVEHLPTVVFWYK